jgi:hypothetical protein
MPTIVGKEAPSITIYYYKGNPFSYTFTVSGNDAPSLAIAKIYRVNDPEKVALIQFTLADGLSISGQNIDLDKTAQEMFMPPGTYEITMEGIVGDVHMPLIQRSLFLINDAIGQQLATPSFIIATAISDSEISVDWNFVTGATSYTLRRSLDALSWATIYTGPNTMYPDFGLTASTLYYYQVMATTVGAADSGWAITNATTLATSGTPPGGGGGGGCSLPPGGNIYDTLAKASAADCDTEWIAFEEVPHDHDGRYYTKDEIDALNFGSGGVFTGTI